jgi:heme-degrading monooxygenase HmoA
LTQDFYFIVAFAVPAGKEADLRREFAVIASRLQQSGGGAGASGVLYEIAPAVENRLLDVPNISAALQNRREGRAEFSFVLIAHWQSLAQYKVAISASDQSRPISFPAFPAYYHVACEYRGKVEQANSQAESFTFINPIEVPTGKEEEFRGEWQGTVERLIAAPGFQSARLYEVDSQIESDLLQTPGISAVLQNRPDAKARFRFIWVSEWTSLAEYEAAVRAYGRGKPFIFPSHPGFYQPARLG